MFYRAFGPRNLAVRDVANEHVEKRVLRLVRDRRSACTLHESLSLKRMQELLDVVSTVPVDEASEPEHLAEHRSVLEQFLLSAGEAIETCGDDSLNRLGNVVGRDPFLVGQHLRELLCVERITAGASQQHALLFGLENRSAEQRGEQTRSVVVR